MSRIAVIAALALAGTARATSLKELLAAAEEKSLERRISLEQRKRAAAEYGQAWSGFFPSATVQGGWTYNQYPAVVSVSPGAPSIVITPRNQLEGLIRFELPLLDTSRWFRAGAAGALDQAAEFRDALNRDNVMRQISTTYYSYAAALAVRESARRSLTVADAQAKLQEIRAKVGAATELELLRARAELQRTRQQVSDAGVLVANMRRALNTLTLTEIDEVATLPPDDLKNVGSLEELEQRTAETPAVKAAEQDAISARRFSTAAKLAFVPSVTANFTERFTNATGFIGQSNSYTAGLGLLWRLDGPTYFGTRVQGANANIASLGAERQRLASRDQTHNDWQRLNAAIEKVTAAEAQVTSARRAAQVARDRYAAGAATQIDVIQAERDLFSADVNHIQARTELASSHVSLRLSAGLPLRIE